MIPVSIRRWFLAHFAINLLIGGPLLLIPTTFLGGMGWLTIDPTSARFCGAALLAVGIQSVLTHNEDATALRTILNFKMVWAWAVIAGLVFAAAEGAPNAVWALLALFIAQSGLWFHLQVKLTEYEEHGVGVSGEMPIFPLSPQLHAAATAQDVEEVSHQFFVDEQALAEVEAANPVTGKSAAFKSATKKPTTAKSAVVKAVTGKSAAAKPAASKRATEAKKVSGPGTEILGERPIDDSTADGLADMLQPRDAAPAGGVDALAADDIAAMLAQPENAAPIESNDGLAADDIAAMLSQGGNDAPADSNDAVAADDIAAMLAQGNDEPDKAVATPVDRDDSLAADDIATMLAQDDEPSKDAAAPFGAVAQGASEADLFNDADAVAAAAPEPTDSVAAAVDDAVAAVASAVDEIAAAPVDDPFAAAALDAPALVEPSNAEAESALREEQTNETSVEQIEESIALDAAAAAAMPSDAAANDDEIDRAIDSVLAPEAPHKAPPPVPPPGRTIQGLPALQVSDDSDAAPVDDDELGGDAIAAMLAGRG